MATNEGILFGGKVVAVRTFSAANKSTGVMQEYVSVTLQCSEARQERVGNMSKELQGFSFMKGRGDTGFEELSALEIGNFVEIRAAKITKSNGFVNVDIDAHGVCWTDKPEEAVYIQPAIEDRNAPKVSTDNF